MRTQSPRNPEVPPFGDDGHDVREKKSYVRHPVASFFHLFFRTVAVLVYLLCDGLDTGSIACMVAVILLLSCDFWTVKVFLSWQLDLSFFTWGCFTPRPRGFFGDENRGGLSDVFRWGNSSPVLKARRSGQEFILTWKTENLHRHPLLVRQNISGRLMVGLRWWNHIDEAGNSQWIFESREKTNQSAGPSADSKIFWIGIIVFPFFWVVFMFSVIISANVKWLVLVVTSLVLQFANLYGYVRCKVGGGSQLRSLANNYLVTQIFRKAVKKADKP